jgi:hypothetical protein
MEPDWKRIFADGADGLEAYGASRKGLGDTRDGFIFGLERGYAVGRPFVGYEIHDAMTSGCKCRQALRPSFAWTGAGPLAWWWPFKARET